MVSSVVSEVISTDSAIRMENGKGGEKIASEWEELEKLTKEELIIELVRERTTHREMDRALRGIIEVDHPADRKLPVFAEEDPEVEMPGDEWVRRIAEYAARRDGVDLFTSFSLEAFGLSEEDSAKGYAMLRESGIISSDRYDPEGML